MEVSLSKWLNGLHYVRHWSTKRVSDSYLYGDVTFATNRLLTEDVQWSLCCCCVIVADT
jgi:hypothetical protein